MPPSRKARHAAVVQESRRPAKQQQQRQQRPPSPDHAVRALNPGRNASAARSWREQLLHLATQEAYTAATLLRLLPSPAPADARGGVQPSQSLLGTAAPPPALSGAGATGGARVQTAQTARLARRSAHDASPPATAAATTEAASLPTQTVEWTSYGELWEGLLACLPLVNGAKDAAKHTPATGGNSDDNGNTGGGKRRGGEQAGHQGDKKAAMAAALADGGTKAGAMNSPVTDVSAMFCTLSNDWRSFFLHRHLRGAAMAGSGTRSAAPAQGHQTAARPQRRRPDNLTCSPYMTHAEQQAIRRYTAAAIAAVPSGARRGVSTVCVLDFL
ncbi:hypothetical protein, unknown function [Leishmania mexicana MHOM/GT/2001/U1103]|uniref:Uncharacterized protein n=1 Tax=Leishmania mexicana (strain MHOM/GT/2001/U1103) TaxID=929439 RepID=E9AMC9_LEIMU|nr:hypothetical protein, unknown function [Leishmania mexicana MHOM/GT/2001/U1103]CBZ24084.1 hypothetical protein, unknown function [Leishmania mexicana MHOM/GT/2001/U1103]